jgi:biotin carboxylase
METKTILILSGGVEALEGIRVAHQIGLKVIVADGDPGSPGRDLADDFIHTNIYNAEEVLASVKKYTKNKHINSVITVAADNPMSVAVVAEYLNIPGPSNKTAEIATNKLLMKEMFEKNNLPVPWYSSVKSPDDISHILCDRPGKYVLKPIDSRGSRGVVRISTHNEIESAWNFSIKYSSSKTLILEEWLEGSQLSTESLVWKGKSYLCGVADRNYNRLEELYPYVVEDGGETPSRFSPDLDNKLSELMTTAARSIGLENGSIKGDIVLTEKGLYIIEVAARLSGGYFSTHTIPHVYGINIIEQIIKIALGDSPELPKRPLRNNAFQANRFLFLPEGKIKSINNIPAKDSETIVFKLYVKEGQEIPSIRNHTQRGGMILCVANTREQTISKCKQIINNLEIKMSS